MPEDVFLTSPRKPANRRSNASLRPLSSPDSSFADGGGGGGGGGFSLAHELAVAMMPEPSAGSKLLAEEFGIEFDEGAEGIDGPGPQIHVQDADTGHGGDERQQETQGETMDEYVGGDADADPAFASPTRAAPARRKEPEVDAMQVLAADLASTDNFLSHLRRLDADASLPPSLSSTSTSSSAFPASPSSSSTAFAASSSSALNGSNDDSKLLSGQPALERLASDVIRRINDTARDRETQLRELLQYEREFRRIEAEVGGKDVLGRLDELDFPPDDEPEPPLALTTELDSAVSPQAESPVVRPKHLRALSQDWETDPDYDRLGDAQQDEEGEEPEMDPAFANTNDDTSPAASPLQASFTSAHQRMRTTSSTSHSPSSPTKPTSSAKPTQTRSTPAHTAATHLTALRTLTTSLASSLTSLSEQAQVNAAASADAGRRLRALRNRLGGWRGEWEGAERSRGRIERWEGGEGWIAIVESTTTEGVNGVVGNGGESGQSTPVKGSGGGHTKRIDGRVVVAEHLRAFERALAEVEVKTKAIMAAS